jgi:hypothetical protein
MSDKKQNANKQKPVHTIRCGEVVVWIYRRQSNGGYVYHDFVLGRCWRSVSTGKEAQGATFFEKNEEDLVRAIREASIWLRERNRPAEVAASTQEHGEHSR